MDWKEILRRRLATPSTSPNKKKSEQELKDEEMDLFTKYYSEWKGGRKNTNEFYKTIPRFYYRIPNGCWSADMDLWDVLALVSSSPSTPLLQRNYLSPLVTTSLLGWLAG
uniref:Protein phosphatase 2 regulatory subunit B''gamma n=1 Tax=Ovis aries TaxID=9940 RepID=A0AC11DFB4_SHEEP